MVLSRTTLYALNLTYLLTHFDFCHIVLSEAEDSDDEVVEVEQEEAVASSNRHSSPLPVSAEKSKTRGQHAKKERKAPPREVEESCGSVQKTARIECSIEGCNRKAAGNGRCKSKHGGRDYCSYEGCTKQARKGGVCVKHGERREIKGEHVPLGGET